LTVDERRHLIDQDHLDISVFRQCELLGLARSSYYYMSQKDDSDDNCLMRLIDEQFTKTPFYGVRRMKIILENLIGYPVNHKRIRRLMQKMGICAIYPKPRTSKSSPDHRIYPYLLRGMKIAHPNQVWCADITYVRLETGFCYLVAIMDWYSRLVLAWKLSNTLDVFFCLDALEEALDRNVAPEIFNSDQGSQFTSLAFTGFLKERSVKISMDGRGRVYDNIFIERLWRSVKYENIYIKDYQRMPDASSGLEWYFTFYNSERPHQSLNYQTPQEVYFQRTKCRL